jgi:putative transposase
MRPRIINGNFRRKTKSRVQKFGQQMNIRHNLWETMDGRISMIQELLPLGLLAVENLLQEEVINLVGERYGREGNFVRWGYNPGSVFLGDQKVGIRVPRVRDPGRKKEIPLPGYQGLQNPQTINNIVFKRVLKGISNRKYEKAAECVPETFGIKKNAVSRRFIEVSSKKLREFQERDLSGYDIVVIFMDGKTFAENEIIIAEGITMKGEKIILGFIESSTENHRVCKDFLNDLISRGLNVDREILFVIDGSKGLRKGIKEIFAEMAYIQRCQWHKRENIVDYFAKEKKEGIRKKLQRAYNQPTEDKIRKKMKVIEAELKISNGSALNSLLEGFEDTLIVHKLGITPELRDSLKTTNCIENINSLLADYTDRVDYWKTSTQRQRWVGCALSEIEPTLRKIRGYRHLPALREAMKKNINRKSIEKKAA